MLRRQAKGKKNVPSGSNLLSTRVTANLSYCVLTTERPRGKDERGCQDAGSN